jgi:hypothetical protein
MAQNKLVPCAPGLAACAAIAPPQQIEQRLAFACQQGVIILRREGGEEGQKAAPEAPQRGVEKFSIHGV